MKTKLPPITMLSLTLKGYNQGGVQTNGPYAGINTALVVNGTSILAGTNNDATVSVVFIFTNNGNSWTPVITGLGNLSIFFLSLSGTKFFEGSVSRLFLSTNNGNSWTLINNGLSGIVRSKNLLAIKQLHSSTTKY